MSPAPETPISQRESGAALSDRPATPSQLLRIGRLLGLHFEEAEALLELMEESEAQIQAENGEDDEEDEKSAAPDRQGRAALSLLRARLGDFSPQLLSSLRAVPGLFLLTDGITAMRLERARDRAQGALSAVARIDRLRHIAESVAEKEVDLLVRAAQAVAQGLRAGVLVEASAALRELLRPFGSARRPQRNGRPVVH